MAKESYRFFDSAGEDRRIHQANDFAEFMGEFFSTGIKNGGANLKVEKAETGLAVFIRPGFAAIEGYAYWLEPEEGNETLVLPLPPAHQSLHRIDRIVLRLSNRQEDRFIRAAIISGEPASAASVQPPELTREGGYYEISLSRVLLPPGSLTTAPLQLTDERLDASVCGLINGLITLDGSEFQAQADAILENLATQGYLPLTGGNVDELTVGERELAFVEDLDAFQRKILHGTAEPSGGQDGDVYIKYS